MTIADTVSLATWECEFANHTERIDCRALPYSVYSPEMIVAMVKWSCLHDYVTYFCLTAMLALTLGHDNVIAPTKQ